MKPDGQVQGIHLSVSFEHLESDYQAEGGPILDVTENDGISGQKYVDAKLSSGEFPG